MRLLLLLQHLGGGGAERSLQELLPGLSSAGARISIATFYTAKIGVADLARAHAPVHPLKGDSLLAKAADLRRLLRRESIDVLHTALFLPDVVGRPVAAGLKTAVVTSLVNMPHEQFRLEHDPNVDPLRLRAVRALEIVSGCLVDRYHAVTRAVRDAYIRTHRLSPDKVSVVYRGRDLGRLGLLTEERRAKIRRDLNVPPETLILFNGARQEYQKGQKFLLQAFSRILTVRPASVLLIAGEAGNATASLQAETNRLGLGHRVRFLGFRSDVPDLMCASDIVVLPSLWEGTAGLLIEAMALGVPIVASNIPSIREVVGDGRAAVLCEPGDAAALAQAVLRVADDESLRREIATAGRGVFQSSFTLDASVRGMMRLFEDALRSRGERGRI